MGLEVVVVRIVRIVRIVIVWIGVIRIGVVIARRQVVVAILVRVVDEIVRAKVRCQQFVVNLLAEVVDFLERPNRNATAIFATV